VNGNGRIRQLRRLHPSVTDRARLTRGVVRAVTSTAGRITARRSAARAVVLCYHSVHPELEIASADPDLFRRHLDWLGENCDVGTVEDVFAAAQGHAYERRPRPVVAITFDDGYEDNFTHAYPRLAEAGMKATFFVTAGLIERDPPVIRRLEKLQGVGDNVLAPMTWEHVREVATQGFTIGSHTYGHPNLARLGRTEALADIERGKEVIESQLGTPVRVFAYPFGRPGLHFTDETVELVRRSGHDFATAVQYRGVRATDDRFAIPRFFVDGDDVDRLKAKVEGYWDPFGLWQQRGSRGVVSSYFDSSGRDYR
jgi:peptidoglycan/xylan/chitin deacetylase (PgdA/CDA1 family)